jgi:Phycobilisome protein
LLHSDVTHPGGNMYTIRRYTAFCRDLDYYLRYSIYAMLGSDCFILDELVLNGLKETYNALSISITSIIQAMREMTAGLISIDAGEKMGVCLPHLL